MHVRIVGAGLAGCEAAFVLAERGIDVTLIEQKPLRRTPAQTTDNLCELVCSNSLRGAALVNAVGLLKEELRRSGSLILRAADATKVPAGGALAVDREAFSAYITKALDDHPRITRTSAIVNTIPEATPDNPVILATGPLTGDELAADLARVVGNEHLAYYDAIAPIVATDSIDFNKVFYQSRWGKGGIEDGMMDATSLGDSAYINCPFEKDEYFAFVEAVVAAKKVEAREFEQVKYFEGCLPFDTMAERGPMTLAFGPMKPVGLTDPRTGRRPYAVLQLRAEDAGATAYNLVGFQTRLTYGEQQRIFRMIPGLENVEILRYGTVHRNTFIDSPKLLDEQLQLRAYPGVYLAGQITGVEGYVESAACGFLVALMLAQKANGHAITPPPPNTALGGLLTHLGRGARTTREDAKSVKSAPAAPDLATEEAAEAEEEAPKTFSDPAFRGDETNTTLRDFQPSNITWACLPPHENRKLKKRDRYAALSSRAIAAHDAWRTTAPLLPKEAFAIGETEVSASE